MFFGVGESHDASSSAVGASLGRSTKASAILRMEPRGAGHSRAGPGSRSALISPTDLDRREIFQVPSSWAPTTRVCTISRAIMSVSAIAIARVFRFGLRNPEAGFARLSTAMSRPAPGRRRLRPLDDRYAVRARLYHALYHAAQRHDVRHGAGAGSGSRGCHDSNDLALFELLFAHLNEAFQIATRPPLLEGTGEPLHPG